MTPPEGSAVHLKLGGQEIDLKGKAAKSAPIWIAILAVAFSFLALWRIETLRGSVDGKFDKIDSKVDKILFILASE